MDKNFRLRSTRKRVTELLLSESGAVDVRRTIGLGVAVTGSMLAAMLLAPHNASSVGNCQGALVQCGVADNYVCCDAAARCCGIWPTYWCCSNPTPHCDTIQAGKCW